MEIHKGICIKKRQGQNSERNSRANLAALLSKQGRIYDMLSYYHTIDDEEGGPTCYCIMVMYD